MFGLSEEQLLGRTAREAFPEASAKNIQFLDTVYKTGEIISQKAYPGPGGYNAPPGPGGYNAHPGPGGYNTHPGPGGNDARAGAGGYYDFTLKPMRNSRDEMTGIMCHVANVTDKVRASERLEAEVVLRTR